MVTSEYSGRSLWPHQSTVGGAYGHIKDLYYDYDIVRAYYFLEPLANVRKRSFILSIKLILSSTCTVIIILLFCTSLTSRLTLGNC